MTWFLTKLEERVGEMEYLYIMSKRDASIGLAIRMIFQMCITISLLASRNELMTEVDKSSITPNGYYGTHA